MIDILVQYSLTYEIFEVSACITQSTDKLLNHITLQKPALMIKY